MADSISETEIEAEFTLESPARCPQCGESIDEIQVVRILRTKVNFVSSLPRRGQVMICPKCRAIITGSLGGLI
jgi:NMD protein affecting ribosome stability and mRNA decay